MSLRSQMSQLMPLDESMRRKGYRQGVKMTTINEIDETFGSVLIHNIKKKNYQVSLQNIQQKITLPFSNRKLMSAA